MEQENVFKNLRQIAAKVEKEKAHLERCINMPPHMRPGARSAELLLKELQCNVQTMTLQAQKDLKEIQKETSFSNLLENVNVVVNLNKKRLNLLQENLEKYGYKKQDTHEDRNVKEQNHVAEKENREPDESSDQEQHSSQHLQTPKKETACEPVTAQSDNASRTPKLADFGISQATLDFLAKQNMASRRKMKTNTAAKSGTPFKMPVPSLPLESEKESPFDPNVILTPGLFGYGRKIPTATPEHMAGAAYLNSPVPPVLQTPGLKQMAWSKNDNTLPVNEDPTTPFQSRSVVSIHPTPTSYHTNITQTIPQPKNIWQAEANNDNDNTPTMPDLLYQPPKSPDDPKLIKTELSKTSLEQEIGTPTEPQMMMSGKQAISAPQTPFQAFKNLHNEDEMPQTPELTLSYARYIDVGASLANSKDNNLPSSDRSSKSSESSVENEINPDVCDQDIKPVTAEVSSQPVNGCQKSGVIAFISEEEFLHQSSILKRLLPLVEVNVWIKKINKYMTRKNDQYLLESEVKNLGMGPRTKAMLLLLVKLDRLGQARPNTAGDQQYYVI